GSARLQVELANNLDGFSGRRPAFPLKSRGNRDLPTSETRHVLERVKATRAVVVLDKTRRDSRCDDANVRAGHGASLLVRSRGVSGERSFAAIWNGRPVTRSARPIPRAAPSRRTARLKGRRTDAGSAPTLCGGGRGSSGKEAVVDRRLS